VTNSLNPNFSPVSGSLELRKIPKIVFSEPILSRSNAVLIDSAVNWVSKELEGNVLLHILRVLPWLAFLKRLGGVVRFVLAMERRRTGVRYTHRGHVQCS